MNENKPKKRTKPKTVIDLSQVEELASQGLTMDQIAHCLNISNTTLFSRKRESAEFCAAIKRGQSKGISFVTNKLMEQCRDGNTAAIIFFLKARANWSDKPQFQIEQSSDNILNITITDAASNSNSAD